MRCRRRENGVTDFPEITMTCKIFALIAHVLPVLQYSELPSQPSDRFRSTIAHSPRVLIERANIDPRPLQAFPFGSPDAMQAVLYAYGFRIDDLPSLRRDTIAGIQANATARFRREVLADAGRLKPDMFALPPRIDSLASLLATLTPNRITIPEEATLDDSRLRTGRYVWRESKTHRRHSLLQLATGMTDCL